MQTQKFDFVYTVYSPRTPKFPAALDLRYAQCMVKPCVALLPTGGGVGSLLGRENMRCREELGRPAGLPSFLRGSCSPAERLLNAPGLVRSSWSECSRLLLPSTPAQAPDGTHLRVVSGHAKAVSSYIGRSSEPMQPANPC